MFNTIINGLCIIGFILLIICFFLNNGNFIDIRQIIRDNIKIYVNNKFQFTVIFIIPLVFSLRIATITCISKDILENLNVVLSIFITMFITILSILSSIKNNNDIPNYNSEREHQQNQQ